MDPAAPYFPLDPHGTSSLLQDVPFLIESQRQTTYRHVSRLQQPGRHDDANKELDHRIIRDKARDDVERLAQLLRQLRDDTADKRGVWRRVAFGLSIPAILLNKEMNWVVSHHSTRGPAAVAALVLLCQSMRREVSPFLAARLERQLAEAADGGKGSDVEVLLAVLESWEWKVLRYL